MPKNATSMCRPAVRGGAFCCCSWQRGAALVLTHLWKEEVGSGSVIGGAREPPFTEPDGGVGVLDLLAAQNREADSDNNVDNDVQWRVGEGRTAPRPRGYLYRHCLGDLTSDALYVQLIEFLPSTELALARIGGLCVLLLDGSPHVVGFRSWTFAVVDFCARRWNEMWGVTAACTALFDGVGIIWDGVTPSFGVGATRLVAEPLNGPTPYVGSCALIGVSKGYDRVCRSCLGCQSCLLSFHVVWSSS